MTEQMSGRIRMRFETTIQFQPAPWKRRIRFVWKWRDKLSFRHALYILKNGMGGMHVRDGEGRIRGTFFV